jgi:hypothetical protein
MLASKRQSYQVVSGLFGFFCEDFFRSATFAQLGRLNAHGHGLVEHGQQDHGAPLSVCCLVDGLDAGEGAIGDDDLVACGKEGLGIGLLKLLALVQRSDELGVDLGRMATLADDHAPPHFHIAGPDINAAFTIENCTLLKGRMDGKKQQMVRWWYERSRPLLVKTWNATRPGDSTVGPTK